MVSERLNKIKSLKILIVVGIALLLVLFLTNKNSFSKTVSSNYTVGEERYKVTMSRELRNIISSFSYSVDKSVTSKFYVNYVDEDGNNFDFSTLTEDIEYDCNGNKCSVGYNEQSEEMFNEKLGYFEYDHGNISITNLDIVLPRNFVYNSITYSLDYYYSSFGCMSSFYFGRIYNVNLNGENINFNRYNLYPMAQYYTDKIKVDDDDDVLSFYWEHFYNKINVYAEDKTERNIFEEITLELTPYNPYGSIGYSHRVSVYSKLKSGITEFLVPGNYLLEVDFIINNYDFMIDVVDTRNIYYNNIPLIKTPYNYEKYSLLPSDTEDSAFFISVENLASPIVISNKTFSEVGGDKAFGYTITFDENINGNIFGIDYVNGVGKIYVKPGYSESIVPPRIGVNYTVKPDVYDDFIPVGNEFTGTSMFGGTSNFDSYYRFSPDKEQYYYGTVVGLEDLVPGKNYIIFRATGGVGYIFTGKGNAKPMTRYSSSAGEKVIWPNSGDAYSNVLWTYNGTPDQALFESFGAVNTYLTVGKSTSGKRPVGNEKSFVKLETTSSPAIRVGNEGYYLALNSSKDKYTSSTSANSLYFAEIDEKIYKVKFNASNEGVHIYEGVVDKEYSVIAGDEIVIPGEDNVKTPEKYNYVLDSWIEISSGMKIKPGENVKVNSDCVFYANWVPKTYDVGLDVDTVDSVDTSSFITTELFDYNELFNMYSSSYNNNRWNLVGKGLKTNTGLDSLGIVFFDNAKNSKSGLLNSVDGRDRNNASRQVDNGPSYYDGIVTTGIGYDVVDLLFDDDNDLLGANYVGEGNYLYQYDSDTGFYYYDSRKNAASYNSSAKRFYVYDYTYGTSKSMVEGENGADFLPFNYMKKSDALAGKSFSSSNGATNYWFGLKSEIDFVLHDDVGYMDSDGEYGNKDVNGNDMILKFSGDDDVWIYIDDKLVLDLGGAHDIVYGEINFSTGVVTTAHNGAIINTNSVGAIGYDEKEVSDTTKIVQTKLTGISAGSHKATFYYVERGASRSNVSLYFNISNKYEELGSLVIQRDQESYASFEKHKFTLELSDTSINGKYGEAKFNDGVTKFELLGGEKIKILGLPADIKYKLRVDAPVEHSTEFNSNGVVYETREILGSVIGGNTSKVQYKNNYGESSDDNNNDDDESGDNNVDDSDDESSDSNDDVVIPDTRDNILKYVVLLITSIFVGIVVILVYVFTLKKKKKVEEIEILTE